LQALLYKPKPAKKTTFAPDFVKKITSQEMLRKSVNKSMAERAAHLKSLHIGSKISANLLRRVYREEGISRCMLRKKKS